MRRKIFRFCFFVFLAFLSSSANAEILKKLEIIGNSRISNETIKVYGEIEINKNYSNDDLNTVIKRLYDTKFFSNISTNFSNGVLKINVKENPIIDSIIIEGEKAQKYIDKEKIWVNPDCGLKTRGWPEVKKALKSMTAVAKILR